MTREEAIDKYMEARNHGVELDTISVINALYDDIESRVCENCKHKILEYGKYVCNHYDKNEYNPVYRKFVGSNFGCNKFKVESK